MDADGDAINSSQLQTTAIKHRSSSPPEVTGYPVRFRNQEPNWIPWARGNSFE